jgi:hypothetical protein
MSTHPQPVTRARLATRVALLAAVAASTLLSACIVVPSGRRGGGYGYGEGGAVAVAPAPQVEVIGVAPGPGYIWIGGFWNLIGGRHVWVGGHWDNRGGDRGDRGDRGYRGR